MGNDTPPVRTTPAAIERKLTAILSADVKDYSRLMGADEVGTLHTLTAYRKVMDTLIEQHHGRVVGTAGDSVLAEFASVVDAVQGAVEIQQALKARNTDLPPERKMEFRIGINVGDVVVEGEQIYGDGVNIAARLQGLADAGGILISGTVYDQIENKLVLNYEDLGEQVVKNIAKPVRVWQVLIDGAVTASPAGAAQRGRPQGLGDWWQALVGAVVLLVGAGIIAIWSLYPSPPPGQPHRVAPTTPQVVVPTEQPPALPLPDKPSIVVLPFVNMSSDPEQEYFSDGITEDITSDLSKISGLFVIARNSAFTYKGKAAKVQDVSKELGVRYVLEGSIRKTGDQIRIAAQLIDATTGYHLWTERYDRPLQDLFVLQDEIVQQIVTRLRVEVREAEFERVRHVPTANMTAYDYWLRGQEFFWRLTKEGNAQAKQMLEKALELDPLSARAHALLGAVYWREWLLQAGQEPQTLERAFALAQKAVELDNSLPGAHGTLGWVSLWKKQHEQAIAEAERDIALDPNSADGYLRLGTILAWAGRPEEAIGMLEKAMRLNPRYPVGWLTNLGFTYVLLGRYAEAIPLLKQDLSRNPNFPDAHTNLAVCYAELGREEEARAEVAEILRLGPHFSVGGLKQISPYKDPAVGERYLAALRKAGLK